MLSRVTSRALSANCASEMLTVPATGAMSVWVGEMGTNIALRMIAGTSRASSASQLSAAERGRRTMWVIPRVWSAGQPFALPTFGRRNIRRAAHIGAPGGECRLHGVLEVEPVGEGEVALLIEDEIG